MDEDIEIINTNTRNQKIINFFINYRKRLIAILVSSIVLLIIFFGYEEYKKKKKLRFLIDIIQQL